MNTHQWHLFRWYGKDKLGHNIRGEQQALHAYIVRLDLERQGITPIWIRKVSKLGIKRKHAPIHQRDLVAFMRQFATLVNAGIPIAQALASLAAGQGKKTLARMISQIQQAVVEGNSLAKAFAIHAYHMPTLVISLIEAGEQSGALDIMLERVAIYYEKSADLRAQIKKALFYPVTVIIISMLITVGLLVFIVPQFTRVFLNFGASLPTVTKVVMSLSQWITQYAWLGLSAMIVIIMSLRKRYQLSSSFAYRIDAIMLKLYIIGPMLQKALIARLCSTLAITFASGMPMVNSLPLVAHSAGNRVLTQAILAVRDGLLTGQRMHIVMQQQTIFPSLLVQMVAVGEESGTLDAMLTKMATYYTVQVDIAISQLSTLIEPLMMVILGLLIGGLVIAMYLPIFTMGSVLSRGAL